ncbi:MAG TPA: efflux RND transporter permease subunit [Candidatus Didemnitutus sp.]|nr:efflux RND transporter permease subunit [Candidatus Didemnitutus sp.]
MSEERSPGIGRFATRHAVSIAFAALVLCLAGIYSARQMPSSVFPQTDFPRVVILVNNGIMPEDEMMAAVTRPIEEAMKEIPGTVSVRSSTARGSAEINVLFDWNVDMVRSELYVMGRLAGIRSDLPASATTEVSRVTFSAFPIIGISLTSSSRDVMDLWETANYTIKPRFLQIPGVAKVELTGGHTPEYHVLVDPRKLLAVHLSLQDVTDALTRNNLVAPAGQIEENYHLYLTTVDGRVHSIAELERLPLSGPNDRPVLLGEIARIERGPEPAYTVVTAQGQNAVLLNVMSQPDGSTLDIARTLHSELAALRKQLPPDMRLAFFYDQSVFVRDSVGSVWDAIIFGLILSVAILFFFLRNWGSVWTAVLTIPISVLITFVAMRLAHMSFNMMTLGGIAAAIGLIIDDAIVVVEAMCVHIASGRPRLEAIQSALGEIVRALVASTLTPVVVFVPLAFLSGLPGMFFRALALTMVVSLLTSLVLALTLTPSLAGWFIRTGGSASIPQDTIRLPRISRLYEFSVRKALSHPWTTLGMCGLILVASFLVYRQLKTDFLPAFDEGGFVIDYEAPPGTSLTETSRQLDQAEAMLRANSDVESYSRRLGTQLGLFITEPYRGDYMVKLRTKRSHTTDEVIASFRHDLNERLPAIRWEFPGILTDLIGDLQLTPNPIEIRLYSADLDWLKKTAPRVEAEIGKISGVVDTFNGLTQTGPSFSIQMRPDSAEHFGLTTQDVSNALSTALLGQTSSSVLNGDRQVNIRVMADRQAVAGSESLRDWPIRTAKGTTVRLSQVADLRELPSEVERDRDDLRQDVVVTARLEGRDLGSAMREVQAVLAKDKDLPAGTVQYGGLFEEQQQAFQNLVGVLLAAILLVFMVLLFEFRSFAGPVAIVFGSVLALFGTLVALWLTGATLNIVSFLGAIIGVGIVAKNGILMLDFVDHLLAEGRRIEDALVHAGLRRLRPVLMTSLAAALGMLPLAYGIGAGADMLRPLAIAVIGALCISVLLSLVATPTVYFVLRSGGRNKITSPPKSRQNAAPSPG